MYTSNWENDSKPQSPQKACGLSIINPQNLSKIFVLVTSVAIIAVILNGAFFSFNSGPEQWACAIRHDFFNVCLNGVAIAVTSIFLTSVFMVKDFILCALNSYSWARWMHLAEAVVFLILTIWWLISTAVHTAIFYDLRDSNITGSVPGISPDTPGTIQAVVGLGFANCGNSFGVFLGGLVWFLCSLRKSKKTVNGKCGPLEKGEHTL